MKTTLLLTLLTASPLLAPAQAPLVLTAANFPVNPTATERSQTASLSGVVPPVRGANRSWDYSLLTPGAGPTTRQYTAGTPAGLPGATRFYPALLNFGAFALVSNQYEGSSATGWYDAGFQIPYQRFWVGAATGGANDSLIFAAQAKAYAPRPVNLPFPASYEQRFTNSLYRGITDYRLKVSAFGLNNTPGQYVQRASFQADSVVGWGTLRIPAAGGAPSNPVRVLLVRQERTQVDSIYLGGAPAPPALLAAFGFTQGLSSRNVTWTFYRENSAQPVLTIFQDPATGRVTNARYSLEANIGLGTRAGRLAELAVAPQPATETLTLHGAGLPGEVLQAELRDLSGRCVAAGALTVGVPGPLLRGLPGGLYLLQLRSARGEASVLRVVKQ